MIDYEVFANLKKFTDRIGSFYGTEDFALYLYSLVKMSKPKTVLELGTGLGTTSLWLALGLKENDLGVLHTIDDGSEWENIGKIKDLLGDYYNENYKDYFLNLLGKFKLSEQVSFYNQKITKIDYLDNIDILFCDYSHGPYSVIKLIADYLHRMSENSFIFIDSASTYYSSFHTLESIIYYLNQGKIPKTLREMIEVSELDSFKEKINLSSLELTHIVENKERNQNSTTQIKISPLDIMPQPRKFIRF